jgi:hypothetical protein
MSVRAKAKTLSPSVPQYRLHNPSGKAVVTLSGRDEYLGPWQSEDSKIEYKRVVGEWLIGGRCLPAAVHDGPTVNEVILAYWRYAEQVYRKNGKPTSELACIRSAMGPLKRLTGRIRTDNRDT